MALSWEELAALPDPDRESPVAAVLRLNGDQFSALAAHAHLDATGTWRQAPAHLLAHVKTQVAELETLVSRADERDFVTVHAQRAVTTCANAANYLAFLAARLSP